MEKMGNTTPDQVDSLADGLSVLAEKIEIDPNLIAQGAEKIAEALEGLADADGRVKQGCIPTNRSHRDRP